MYELERAKQDVAVYNNPEGQPYPADANPDGGSSEQYKRLMYSAL